jgi:hypothetical protein
MLVHDNISLVIALKPTPSLCKCKTFNNFLWFTHFNMYLVYLYHIGSSTLICIYSSLKAVQYPTLMHGGSRSKFSYAPGYQGMGAWRESLAWARIFCLTLVQTMALPNLSIALLVFGWQRIGVRGGLLLLVSRHSCVYAPVDWYVLVRLFSRV